MSTDNLCAEWYRLHESGLSWAQIAEQYPPLTGNAIKKRVRKWRLKHGAAADGAAAPSTSAALPILQDDQPIRFVTGAEVKGEIVFEDKKPLPNDDDVKALLDAYLNVIEKAKPFNLRQRVATVRITGDLPVGLVFFGDSHVGSWGWAAARQLEDLYITAQTDGLYPSFLGDEWDNFIFGFGKWASVMPPDHQRRIAHFLFKAVFPKTIAVVGGNHLHWTKKVADIDLNAELAEKARAVFLGHRGDLFVRIGQETYHIYLQHRARNASTVNKSNSGRVTANDIGGADVIVEADRHDPWLHSEYHNRKRQVWLRCGTYKVEDDYPDEIGMPQGKWDMPMVILLPDTHRVVPFLDFRDGIDTLLYLREKYRKGMRKVVA